MDMTNISIYDKKAAEGEKILSFRLVCRTAEGYSSPRLRVMAKWQFRSCDRNYPVVLQRVESEKNTYAGDVTLEADSLFFDEFPKEDETVSLRLAYCDEKQQWVVSKPLWELPGSFFQKNSLRESVWKRSAKKVLYVVCTLLLPIWLLHGLLAWKGYAKLHGAARSQKGKKAVFFHAQGLVKQWTGYGYSIREFKTNYMKHCYDRACRRQDSPRGILLLSERRLESGGNMDLVRKGLQQRKQPFEEFFTTKQVHQLSFGELRRCGERIASAKLVILEDFFPQLHALDIRRETKILQLWHACGAFKLFGLSDLGIVDHLEQSSANHRNYSAAIVSSPEIIPFYSEAFGIPQSRIKPVGVPRTDIFFQPSYRRQVRERLWKKYPVCRGRKVVLFAPTFRGSGNKTAYYPREFFPVEEIIQVLPEDTVLLVRHHPFVRPESVRDFPGAERVLDVSREESGNDFLMLADLLVTDYSSIIFEGVLLHLPILFYVFDLENYLESRDLYFDFSSFAPGEIVRNLEQLKNILPQAVTEEFWEGRQQDTERFRQFFLGSLDGKSTERTMNLIEEMMES
jgi:CDP-glycerol glycerophosphotransferase (TagB/SpsB family)